MSPKTLFALVGGLLIIAFVSGFVYTVNEMEKAIVLQFREIKRSEHEPGWHVKIPFINEVVHFDARIQTLDTSPQLYLTAEKKNLVVDSFVKWRIRDVAKYWVTVDGFKNQAESRLSARINTSLRDQFGQRTVQEVISGERDVIMDVVRKTVDEEAKAIGIEVVDVRLKRVDLDPDISERVYSRMEAERSRVAKELRAQGAEAAERIRADADRRRQITLANAYRDAEQLRGEGDAEATATYAAAFNEDREFYRLYRSLNAYRETFRSQEDLIVLDPSSEFFRYFKEIEVDTAAPASDAQ
ncbi:MAG: protease modulator HflC [Gammaproteobacteria bacterium]|nr:protease modulator HflC [Gammaproteobacteria bacterium]